MASVKVKVSALLAAVREAREAQIALNAKHEKEEQARFEKWKKEARAAIDTAVITEYDRVPNWSPRRVNDLSSFDRDIRILEMAASETINVSATSEFSKYL